MYLNYHSMEKHKNSISCSYLLKSIVMFVIIVVKVICFLLIPHVLAILCDDNFPTGWEINFYHVNSGSVIVP